MSSNEIQKNNFVAVGLGTLGVVGGLTLINSAVKQIENIATFKQLATLEGLTKHKIAVLKGVGGLVIAAGSIGLATWKAKNNESSLIELFFIFCLSSLVYLGENFGSVKYDFTGGAEDLGSRPGHLHPLRGHE